MSDDSNTQRARVDSNFRPLPTLGRLLLVSTVVGAIIGCAHPLGMFGETVSNVGEAIILGIGVMWTLAFMRFIALWIMSYAEPQHRADASRREKRRARRDQRRARYDAPCATSTPHTSAVTPRKQRGHIQHRRQGR